MTRFVLLLLGVAQLESTAHASGGPIFSAGFEGGYSSAHTLEQQGGHLAIRASIVELQLQDSLQGLVVAKQWKGCYARFERNPQDQRGVIGAGQSLKSIYGGFVGIEGGMLLAQSSEGVFGGGAEVTGLLTTGVIGLYIRESVIYTGSGSWQTDIGLRVNLPFLPK